MIFKAFFNPDVRKRLHWLEQKCATQRVEMDCRVCGLNLMPSGIERMRKRYLAWAEELRKLQKGPDADLRCANPGLRLRFK